MSLFNYAPHPAQIAIHQARDKRFRTVCTGRRFGKTLCLAAELLSRGGSEKAGEYGWIAPTYNVADRGIEAIRMIAEGNIEVSGRAPTRVEFRTKIGMTRIWFLSADNPDNIRGFGFQGVVIDEAAAIPVSVWHYVLRPTIAQTLGWAVFVSTPKGRNWFYDLYTRGMDPNETDYASFTFPSKASPFFPAKEWEEAKRTLPADVFRQEYEAEFMEDSAGVFRNVDACTVGGGQLAVGSEDYHRNVVIGCDVAKHTDWTVLIAMDAETGRCFAMERFNHLDWPIQKERILGFARKYRGRIILDATGVGDPIYDDLKRVYGDIEGFKFTSGSKTALVQRLIVAVEQRKVSWPATSGRSAVDSGQWDILTSEMKRYEYEISPSGGITYNAPSGYHDDCVMALALANHRRWETESCGNMLRVEGGERRGGVIARRRERVLAG
ncbi:MAG: terminase family protein [bacterium]